MSDKIPMRGKIIIKIEQSGSEKNNFFPFHYQNAFNSLRVCVCVSADTKDYFNSQWIREGKKKVYYRQHNRKIVTEVFPPFSIKKVWGIKIFRSNELKKIFHH